MGFVYFFYNEIRYCLGCSRSLLFLRRVNINVFSFVLVKFNGVILFVKRMLIFFIKGVIVFRKISVFMVTLNFFIGLKGIIWIIFAGFVFINICFIIFKWIYIVLKFVFLKNLYTRYLLLFGIFVLLKLMRMYFIFDIVTVVVMCEKFEMMESCSFKYFSVWVIFLVKSIVVLVREFVVFVYFSFVIIFNFLYKFDIVL